MRPWLAVQSMEKSFGKECSRGGGWKSFCEQSSTNQCKSQRSLLDVELLLLQYTTTVEMWKGNSALPDIPNFSKRAVYHFWQRSTRKKRFQRFWLSRTCRYFEEELIMNQYDAASRLGSIDCTNGCNRRWVTLQKMGLYVLSRWVWVGWKTCQQNLLRVFCGWWFLV